MIRKRNNLIFFFSTLFLVIPVILLALKSFSFSWRYGDLYPKIWSLNGWEILLKEPRIWQAIQSSWLIGITVVLLNLLIAIPAGRIIAFHSFRGKWFFELLFTLPILIPSLAVVMGLHLTMIRLGLTDHWMGVVIVHLLPSVPYTIKIFHASFERIGPHLEDQAVSLGSSKWYSFYSIYLPLLVPSIRSTVFLVFVISLSQYVLTAIIGGGNVVTIATLYFPFLSTVKESVISSFSLIFAILPLTVLLLFELLIQIFIPYRKQNG
ncbi:ABC transporter permease subunit [Anoxybacillus sp. LAT_35]|nr:ABC transporter permease subunit [Anoxybacillus sp. LAT_11]MCG6176052.1 ABC transporter permease subunit [Anoxybacillus sp. LAT_31]MCG6178325.1 ABC transporter permease subunit [Anoxybacillus sp. LAT_35]MCG6181072.1 ABC transporter permease subunit [Anoxybacillus sp. LAT_33]MCG6183385.1 ABC transporter permease subunit [Anoxybacillus sp. LAT_26]MCG6196334.1 ABC transporter permease subunit [Anoxybacillus sp. LAT_38]